MPKPAKTSDTTPYATLDESRIHKCIGYQVAQASIAALNVFHQTVGDTMELRPVEYTILNLIHDNPGVTVGRLARALAVTSPNVVQWVSRLELRGFIGRVLNAADRRAQGLHTTTIGAKLALQSTKRLLEAEHNTFSNLSEAERAMLVELLHKVALKRSADMNGR